MNLGAIVEVAIGLIFVWIVLSLTTIQIQEWINTRLDKRAKDMEEPSMKCWPTRISNPSSMIIL